MQGNARLNKPEFFILPLIESLGFSLSTKCVSRVEKNNLKKDFTLCLRKLLLWRNSRSSEMMQNNVCSKDS